MRSAIQAAQAASPAIALRYSLIVDMNMPMWQATSSLRTSSKSSAVSVLHSSYGCGFLAASIAAVSLSFLCLVILLMTHTFSVALKGHWHPFGTPGQLD